MKYSKALPVFLGGAALVAACSSGNTTTTTTAHTTPLNPLASTTKRAPAPSAPPKTSTPVKKAPPAGGKVVYLTFDDGPLPRWTDAVLAVLQKEQVPATFFELGPQVKAHPELSKKLHDAGMSVQLHGWDHVPYTEHTRGWMDQQLTATISAITEATGEKPTCGRPPYGSTNSTVRAAYRAAGLKQILWDDDSMDWSKPGVNTIVSTVMKEVHPGATILFHDGGGRRDETVAALPVVIDKLKARGYSFAYRCVPTS